MSAIEAADREDELSAWLDDHDVANAFQIAPTFVQAGIDSDWLDLVANGAPSGSLAGAIHWLYYTVDTELLMKEITDSATRISTLVGRRSSTPRWTGHRTKTRTCTNSSTARW